MSESDESSVCEVDVSSIVGLYGSSKPIAQLSLDSVPAQIEAESALYWGVRLFMRLCVILVFSSQMATNLS